MCIDRSSRKIAAACERNLAFLAIVGNQSPDFRTISDSRQFLLRGLKNIQAEWKLVCLTHNLLKIWRRRFALTKKRKRPTKNQGKTVRIILGQTPSLGYAPAGRFEVRAKLPKTA